MSMWMALVLGLASQVETKEALAPAAAAVPVEKKPEADGVPEAKPDPKAEAEEVRRKQLRGDVKKKYVVYEWAVWFAEPASKELNARSDYVNNFPAFSESLRSSIKREDTLGASPIGLMTFSGEEVTGLDVEIQLKSGRPLASWPKGELKNRRLIWTGLKTSRELSGDAQAAYCSEDHWLSKVRGWNDTLHVSQGVRAERGLTYDLELTVPIPLKIEGGPDTYKVTNQTEFVLKDVLVSTPTAKGRRIGWLASLPAGKAAPKPATAPAANKTAAAAVTEAKAQLLRSKSKSKSAQSTPAKSAPPATPAVGVAVDLAMLSPIQAGDPKLAAETVDHLKSALLAEGFPKTQVDFLVGSFGKTLFESEEMVVVCRLDSGSMEQLLPLELFPEPERRVRSALIVLSRIDPGLGAEVDGLIAKLGAKEFDTREAAEARLKKLGSVAFPALKKATKNADLEVVYRSERILLSQKQSID